MTNYIYNDNIGYVTDEVSSIKTFEANLNEENRMKFVTDLAAISRGKINSNNPKLRYDSLMKETRKKRPSRPLEFLPIVLEMKFEQNGYIRLILKDGIEMTYENIEFMNKIAPFSRIEQLHNIYQEDGMDQFFLFTNMRCLINASIIYEQIPYANEIDKELYKQFKALRAKVPMFVWSQIMTHTQISKTSQSDRVSESTDYWLPEDIVEKIKNASSDIISYYYDINELVKYNKVNREQILDVFLNQLSQTNVASFLRKLGYPKEIYNRAPYYFKYKEFVMTGWYNNKNSWFNMLHERNAIDNIHDKKNWTQNETNVFALAVADIIKNTTL